MQSRYPANRPLRARQRLAILAAGLAVYLAFTVSARIPGVTESLYGAGLGPVITRILSSVTAIVPFSLAELLVLGFIGVQVVRAGLAVVNVRRGRRQLSNALASGALRLGRDFGIAVGLFYLLWGFNYARLPLAEQLGLDGSRDASVEEVSALAERMVDRTNRAYLELHGVDDAGEPTQLEDRGALITAINEGWETTTTALDLPRAAAARFGSPKDFLASPIVRQFRIAGMYFPFTGEALVVRGLPAISYALALAHEQAHQRGFAVEAEANALGFFVAANSSDPLARYAAALFAQRQLLSVFVRTDPERARELVDARLPGVQRDVDDQRAYFLRYDNPMSAVASRANDRYLRTNRVASGVLSYSESAWILIAYARVNGGRLP